MPIIKVAPNAGLNRRFPEHKIAGDKKQYCQKLWNMINLNGEFYKVGGASRFDANNHGDECVWAKRIYYNSGSNPQRFQFSILHQQMYRGNENDGTFSQVPINNDLNIMIENNFYPIDAVLKISGNVNTYLVDGTYFYKFTGNEAGEWERLQIKTDLDGNTIEPVFICEYLDRMWVLCKNRNVLLGSKNLNPEVYDDATDSVLLQLPPGNGGFPKGLAVHPNGYLYVIHEDYYVPVTGSSASTFGIRPGDITKGHGTRAPRSIVVFPDTIGFLESKNSEYYLMNNLATPLSYDIKLGEMINPVKAQDTVCHIDTQLNCLRVSYFPTGGTTLGDEELYSLDEKKWCGETRGRNISCYSQWNGDGDDGRLLTGRSDTGVVMVNDASIQFDNTAIQVWFQSGSYIAESEISDVQFGEVWIDGVPTGDYTIPLTYYLDSRITTNGEADINMQGEGFTLGLIIIADQKSFVNRDLFFIDKCKGRMIRFEINWQALNNPLRFYGIYASYYKDATKQTKYLVGK